MYHWNFRRKVLLKFAQQGCSQPTTAKLVNSLTLDSLSNSQVIEPLNLDLLSELSLDQQVSIIMQNMILHNYAFPVKSQQLKNLHICQTHTNYNFTAFINSIYHICSTSHTTFHNFILQPKSSKFEDLNPDLTCKTHHITQSCQQITI